ncbi:carbohydrate ABC transporter permease [Streptomyces sp. NPDC058045]|uniref:carbohydrate ABC transporter permease n=1 Tax=Streptomyces sp. NPDC058045 TaxID=3346311 RepID=UPI0036ECBC6F
MSTLTTGTGTGSRAARRPRLRLGRALLGWATALVFCFPAIWMVVTAFRPEGGSYTSLGFTPTLDEFRRVLGGDMVPYLMNSAMATVISVLLTLALAAPAAYALAIRPVRKWRDSLFFLISTRMMPPAASIVPLYLIARDAGLLDNVWALILLYTAMNLPLAVWMLRSYFMEVPVEVLEAARMDGAGLRVQITTILLPLTAPGIAATALICAIFSWNEFFFAVNFTTTTAGTVPVYLSGLITGRGLFLAQLCAASLLASLPVILLGWIAQKQLVRGLTMGAVK